jgi:glutaredoxin
MFFIYGKYDSKACDRAEFLLYTLNYEYRFYILGKDFTLAQFQRFFPERNTVPQIFYNTSYIGGIKELYEYLYSNKSLIDGKSNRLSVLENPPDINLENKSN